MPGRKDPHSHISHSTGWFDIQSTSLDHLAELLAGFELGASETWPAPSAPDLATGPDSQATGPPRSIHHDRSSAPTGVTEAQGGPNPVDQNPTAALNSGAAYRASPPVGEDHPTRVYQFDGLRFFADDPVARGRFDDVPGIGPAAETVSYLMVKRTAKLALDLGCGGGLLSLLIARHAERVIGTDLNPRAVALASINARWNGVENVEFRAGDLFDPVRGMQFDLIVSNPPFVISPDQQYFYRDGTGPAGGICDRIMSELPSFLKEAGFATIQCHWPVRGGETWWQKPARWIRDSGSDLWLISYGMLAPEKYARIWLASSRPGEPVSPQDLDRWVSWYREQDIAHLAAGVLVLRKRSAGQNWARAVVAPRPPAGDCSYQLQRIFAAHDDLTSTGSRETLLDLPLGFPPASTIILSAGHEDDNTIGRVTCDPDPGFDVSLSGRSLSVIKMLDGQRTAREVMGRLFPGDDNGALAQKLGADLRRLYGSGLLAPGGAGGRLARIVQAGDRE